MSDWPMSLLHCTVQELEAIGAGPELDRLVADLDIKSPAAARR